MLAGETTCSKMDTSPANLCTNSTQDKKILSILEVLEQVQSTSVTNSDPISGYFCSGTAFNLSKEFLSDMEINSGKRVRLRPQQN